jgi:hypothetical protein
MTQKSESNMTSAGIGNTESLKKKYQKPVLTTHGLVRHLTQSTGTKNGDGGQNMMV